MKIYDTKKEAVAAIKKYAAIMKQASEETGASFEAYASDDTGLEYYIEASYRCRKNKIEWVRIHTQDLSL